MVINKKKAKVYLVIALAFVFFSFTEIEPRKIHVGNYRYIIKPEVVRDHERGITVHYNFYRLFNNGKTATKKEECGYVEYLSCGDQGNGSVDILKDTLLIKHYYQEGFRKGDTNFFLLDTTLMYYKPTATGKLEFLQIIHKPKRVDTLYQGN